MLYKASIGIINPEAVVRKNIAFTFKMHKRNKYAFGSLKNNIASLLYLYGFFYANFKYLWLFIAITIFIISIKSIFILKNERKGLMEIFNFEKEIKLEEVFDNDEINCRIKKIKFSSLTQFLILIVWVYAWKDAILNT